MTIREALQILKPFKDCMFDQHGCPISDAAIALDVVIKELENREWIPCSERLPVQEEKSYWICTDGGYQCQCRWTNINHFWTDLTTDWHWHIVDVPQYSKVVAWKPLPQPWEGADDEADKSQSE